MTRPTWINLVCPACGCLPLEEPIGDAVRHLFDCKVDDQARENITAGLFDTHGSDAVLATIGAYLDERAKAA